MATTLSFKTLSDDCFTMQVSYGIGAEDAEELFCLLRERPVDVVREGPVYRAMNGRQFQTGIVVVGGHGCGVAWPI